jgi:hypothetical protein
MRPSGIQLRFLLSSLVNGCFFSQHVLYSSRGATVHLSHRIGIHRRRSVIDDKQGIRKRLIRRGRETLPDALSSPNPEQAVLSLLCAFQQAIMLRFIRQDTALWHQQQRVGFEMAYEFEIVSDRDNRAIVVAQRFADDVT